MKNLKRRKKGLAKAKIMLVVSVIFVVFAGIIIYANNIMNTAKIYKNISVNEQDVSNLSVEAAKSLLETKFKFGILSLTNGERTWTQDLSEIGFSYDIDDAVTKAYNVGRGGNFVSNALKVLALNFGANENIELKLNENYAKLDEFYSKIKSEIDSNPVNASVSVESGNVYINDSKDGYEIDMEKLKKDVETALKSSEEKSVSLQLPIKVTKAAIQTSDLSSINGLIATYTTKYSTREAERSFNVALTAEKVNNQLLMPGEEVSFMNRLGDVSVANGFKAAKIIVNNEYQDGIGGGVCQVSSTLYNALLLGGMDVTQRINHTFPIGYVPIGRDATVATNGPDLKYKNNYDFPVYIKTSAYNGVMLAQIYGDTSRNKKVELYSEVTETINPTLVYKNDPNLPLGKEEIEDPGHTGYTSVTYKIVNGEKKVVSRDRYTMTPKIIRTGTGPAQAPLANPNQQTSSEETNQEQQVESTIF